MIKELWQSRELVFNLVKRDVKTRYKESVLGFFWSFMKPLLLMVILNLVFSNFVKLKLDNDSIPYGLHLLCALLPWIFFAGGLSEATNSIVANSSLIKKVHTPNAVFPLSSILANLFHFCMALLVLFVFMIFYRVKPTLWILLLPVVILIQFIFIFGLSLILSSLNVFFRDVSSLLEVGLTAWFYLCPIIYPIYMVKEMKGTLWYILYMLNPMAVIIALYRRILLYPAFNETEIPDSDMKYFLIIALIVSLLLYFIGRMVFEHYSKSFADEV